LGVLQIGSGIVTVECRTMRSTLSRTIVGMAASASSASGLPQRRRLGNLMSSHGAVNDGADMAEAPGCCSGWLPNRRSPCNAEQVRRKTLIGLNRKDRQHCTMDSVDIPDK